MNYYTYYHGHIVSGNTKEEEVARAIANIFFFIEDIEEENLKSINSFFDFANLATWPTFIKDMTEISKQFPDCTICIEGEGEDREDLWKHYFKNGKNVRHDAIVTITFPEFNEDELR